MNDEVPFLIVGGGAAGLYAAWTAARVGIRPVMVLDRMPQPGMKLAATGGGRGNISHAATESDFAEAFGKQGRFTLPAFRALTPDMFRRQLADIGVATVQDSTGRIYPKSESADTFRNRLVAAIRATGGVDFLTHAAVCGIQWADDGFVVRTDGNGFRARCVLLAAGGKSAAHLGSDGSGWMLAEQLGHLIVPPVPALTGVAVRERWVAAHSGLGLKNVRVFLDVKGRKPEVTGDVLFTHHGLSGPAILDVSREVSRRLQAEEVVRCCVEVMPERAAWEALRKTAGGQTVFSWLAKQEAIPRALAETLLALAPVPRDRTFSRLSADEARRLDGVLHALPFTVEKAPPFSGSMVTAGGVALKQVNPQTLESRVAPGLFLAGEVLDLDGPTGGWNLHWAFASGHFAARQAAAKLKAE